MGSAQIFQNRSFLTKSLIFCLLVSYRGTFWNFPIQLISTLSDSATVHTIYAIELFLHFSRGQEFCPFIFLWNSLPKSTRMARFILHSRYWKIKSEQRPLLVTGKKHRSLLLCAVWYSELTHSQIIWKVPPILWQPQYNACIIRFSQMQPSWTHESKPPTKRNMSMGWQLNALNTHTHRHTHARTQRGESASTM